MPFRFFSEGIRFNLPHPRKTATWLSAVAKREKLRFDTINFVFCSDSYLLEINRRYLSHDTYTDIITFPYEDGDRLHADVYISVPRVKENARTFCASFDHELHRVMVHGLLHLAGHKDKKKVEKALMRKKEEAYLSLQN